MCTVGCHRCNGTGEIFVERYAGEDIYDTCTRCDGEGILTTTTQEDAYDFEIEYDGKDVFMELRKNEYKPLTYTIASK